jgi:glycine cleavage system H protein
MQIPADLRYTREHEWVRIEDGTVRVGITDFAQDALGDVVYVQVPDVGAEVAALEACCEVESTKSVSDVYSPVSGTVIGANADLADAPQRINEDPYGEGWIFAVQMSQPSEVDALLTAEQYQALLDES